MTTERRHGNTPTSMASPAIQVVNPDVVSFYIASKTTHAPRWRELRDHGVPIVSSWIDAVGTGPDFGELWDQKITEASNCDRLIVFRAHAGEVLTNSLIEVGAALSNSIPVFAIGCEDLGFAKHADVTHVPSVEAALSAPIHLELDEDDEDESPVVACAIGDYGAPESRQWATVLFHDQKVAECYTNDDALMIADALRVALVRRAMTPAEFEVAGLKRLLDATKVRITRLETESAAFAHDHDRYEAVRLLTPHSFQELWTRNMQGERFDELVDDLVKAMLARKSQTPT